MNTIHNIYSPDMILMANELVKQSLRNLGIYDRLAAVEEACNIDPPSPPEQEPDPEPTGTPINLTSASWTTGATYGSNDGVYNTSSSTWMCTGKKDCDSTTYKYVKISWSNASNLNASVHFFKGNDGATWISREQLVASTSSIDLFEDGVAVVAIPDDTTKIAFVAGKVSGSGYTPVVTDVSDFTVELFEEDPS